MTESFVFWKNFLTEKKPVDSQESEIGIVLFYDFSKDLLISYKSFFDVNLSDEISFHKKDVEFSFNELYIHRTDGPAVFTPESQTYFINNHYVSETEFWNRDEVIKSLLIKKVSNL